LYIKEECRGKGIGRKLLRAVVEKGQEAGLHTVVARIVEGNKASVSLFGSEDFEVVGLMKEVGCKFGKLLNVVMMQKIYNSGNGQAE
jgi:phosphinothricin acetyltransferase